MTENQMKLAKKVSVLHETLMDSYIEYSVNCAGLYTEEKYPEELRPYIDMYVSGSYNSSELLILYLLDLKVLRL